jgi:phenylalanyl-tRNA synthetase alpha subunit
MVKMRMPTININWNVFEVLTGRKPMFETEIPMFAWGLGLERSIMEYYGISDVREVYANDLGQLRTKKVWMK